MCLAINKPAGIKISRALMERAFAANSDGSGFAFAENGKLFVEKGFFTFQDFWKAYSQIDFNLPMIIHHRIASVGIESKANCHPFLINADTAVIHNGTLLDWINEGKKSDTYEFVNGVLKPLLQEVPDAYLHPTFQYMLDRVIDTGNKLVFLDSKGRSAIIRQRAGEFFRGSWFSNDSYTRPIRRRWANPIDDYSSSGPLMPRKKEAFPPLSPTEQLLGARSQLGEITKDDRKMRSGSSKDFTTSRFNSIKTGREDDEPTSLKAANKKATIDYLAAVHRQDPETVARFLDSAEECELTGMMV